MKPREQGSAGRAAAFVVIGLAAALATGPARAAAPAGPAGKVFPSPEAAVDALVAAAKSDDAGALLAVLGPDAKPIVSSGDPVADRERRETFVSSYDASHSIVPSGDGEMTLQTGRDNWPLPIPLVKADGGWRFDTARGKEEILARRIGRDELSAIQACLAYGDAQREYAARNPTNRPIAVYAQHLASTPGKRDGLYWPASPGEPPSPLGPLFAEAKGRGYELGSGKGEPYLGYRYHILTAQGANAPGGAYDYVVRGDMIGGFGLVAWPAEWKVSGVYTFVVNQEGVVYEKDLGPDTAEIASQMKRFDPDPSWTRIADAAAPAEPPAAAPAPAAAER